METLKVSERVVRCPDCGQKMKHDGRAHKFVCTTRGCHVLFVDMEVRFAPINPNGSRYEMLNTVKYEVMNVKRESVPAGMGK